MLKKFHTAIALGMGAMILAPDAFAVYTTAATATETATAYVTSNLDVSMTGSEGRVLALPIKTGELLGTFTIDVTSTDPALQKAKLTITVTPEWWNCSSGLPRFLSGTATGNPRTQVKVVPDSNWKSLGSSCKIEYASPTTLGSSGRRRYVLNYSAAQDYTNNLESGEYIFQSTVTVTAP